IDELNRFTSESLAMLLQGIDTGIWIYAGFPLRIKDRVVFATINYPDEGNSPLITPIIDRFAMVLEVGRSESAAVADAKVAHTNTLKDLCIGAERLNAFLKELHEFVRGDAMTVEGLNAI
ncbi:MAG: hypothetical protein QXF76_03355, partial [Candidatus Anstonellales archaeon]